MKKIFLLDKKNFTMLTILTLLAAITRLYGLGKWAIDGDEVLSYGIALNYSFNIPAGSDFLVSLFFSIFGASEFTFRLPSVLFGIAGIPLFYIFTKKIFGRFTAFYGSLFIIFSFFHLRHSQFGRYYSEVFFFATLAFYSYYKFFKSYKKKYLAGALISSFLGFLTHPTFLVVPFANGVFALIVLFNKNRFHNNTIHAAKLFLIISGIIAILVSPLCIKIIKNWYSIPEVWGYEFFKLGLQVVKHFSIPITLSSIFGLILIFKKDFVNGIYFLILICLPLVLLMFASFLVNVRPAYIMCIYPLLFILSGYFCAQLKDIAKNHRFFYITVVILIIFCMLPEFISHYSGMLSLDVRDTEPFFDKNHQNGDKILSFYIGFDFYYKNKYEFENYEGILDSSDLIRKLEQCKNAPYRLWIIIDESRSGISPQLKNWLLENARLAWEKSERRYDYSFKSLRIYVIE